MASTTPSTMASAKAVEAAKAVNSLLHFSSGDQEALLEVMEEFFCTQIRLKPMIVTLMTVTMSLLILKLVHIKLR